ncbi:angiopoietin-related protein 1-like [Anopheles aquasalis]|uniref:angiopoietin-related protein 1-like n=1 Tax=Anopheles aquasalis TaxID=42839 RepID=UPI00215AA554|nr:angiopoietin-related protein 1-like [Anopheles aquasalis]
MKRIVWLVVCCAALSVGASDRARPREGGIITSGIVGYGLEVLLTKLDSIEHKLQKMQTQLNEYRSTREGNLINVEHKLENQATPNTSGIQERIDATLQKILQQVGQVQKDCSYHKHTLQLMMGMPENSVHTTLKQDCATPSVEEKSVTPTSAVPDGPSFFSCKDTSSNVSGTYLIRVKNGSVPFKVFCEQQKFEGGWIVIQHRYDGSLNFYRNWNEFRDGFGDLEKEFWLGLEKVYQITKDRAHEIIIELKDFSGNYKYARYDSFEIGSECERYFLKNLGSYNGTAGNAMSYNKGLKFTTMDSYGKSTAQCTIYRQGAWWHERDCTRANLNGRYINALNWTSMFWYDFDSYRGLSFSRMMIREVE